MITYPPISVSGPNTFTATQTIQNDTPLTLKAASGATMMVINSGPSPTVDPEIIFYATNGAGPNGEDWIIGLDGVAAVPYRDIVVGAKVHANGTVADIDGIYFSHCGDANPSSLGIGKAQPGDPGSGFNSRVVIKSGATTQECLALSQFAGQTAHMVSLYDSGGVERQWVDTSVAGSWKLVLAADTGTANTVLQIQDRNTTTPSVQILADGHMIALNPNNAEVYWRLGNGVLSSYWDIAATGEVTLQTSAAGTLITLGNHATSWSSIGFFGAAAVVQPATTGTVAGFTAGAGTAMNSASTSTGGTGAKAYTFGDIVLALKQLGLVAS